MLRSFGIITLVAFLAFSCRHNTTCAMAVYCCDVSGLPKKNVTVQLYHYATGQLPSDVGQAVTSGVSDSTGYVYFTMRLPGLFTAHASDGATSGSANIESLEGHLASQKVVMQ